MDADRFQQVSRRLISATAIWNVLQNVVFPAGWYTAANGVATGSVLTAAKLLNLSRAELGMGAGFLRRGARLGGRGAVAVAGVTWAAAAHPRTRPLFRDERGTGAPPSEAAFQTLVRIPLGTALFEEVLFRGVLLGWLAKGMPLHRAVAGSSALFGAWHVIPTWQTLAVYQGGAIRRRRGSVIGAELVGVASTTLIGAGFCWLRIYSGSILAPVLVHAAANGAGYLAAWAIANDRL